MDYLSQYFLRALRVLQSVSITPLTIAIFSLLVLGIVSNTQQKESPKKTDSKLSPSVSKEIAGGFPISVTNGSPIWPANGFTTDTTGGFVFIFIIFLPLWITITQLTKAVK